MVSCCNENGWPRGSADLPDRLPHARVVPSLVSPSTSVPANVVLICEERGLLHPSHVLSMTIDARSGSPIFDAPSPSIHARTFIDVVKGNAWLGALCRNAIGPSQQVRSRGCTPHACDSK